MRSEEFIGAYTPAACQAVEEPDKDLKVLIEKYIATGFDFVDLEQHICGLVSMEFLFRRVDIGLARHKAKKAAGWTNPPPSLPERTKPLGDPGDGL